jgi:hypothetical protein
METNALNPEQKDQLLQGIVAFGCLIVGIAMFYLAMAAV